MAQFYNFEGAKKIRFYVMGEESGAKVNFKAVGNDKAKTTGQCRQQFVEYKNDSANKIFSRIKNLHLTAKMSH